MFAKLWQTLKRCLSWPLDIISMLPPTWPAHPAANQMWHDMRENERIARQQAAMLGGIDRNSNPYWRNTMFGNSDQEEDNKRREEARDKFNQMGMKTPMNTPPLGNLGAAVQKAVREPSQQITFVYKNWKGEIRERRVVPLNIEFGHDNYHVPDQWLLHAIDMEKGARRTFAFEHILSPIRRV